jgi:hypothetical protein
LNLVSQQLSSEEVPIDLQRSVNRFERFRPLAGCEELPCGVQLGLQGVPGFPSVHARLASKNGSS